MVTRILPFFHLLATVRKKRNTLNQLSLENEVVSDPMPVKGAIFNHLKSHFQNVETIPLILTVSFLH